MSRQASPFLQQVAQIYAYNERDNLADYCFVMPNKRSAAFLAHFLSNCMTDGGIMPQITTIADFVASLAPTLTIANRYDKLLTLFNCYSQFQSPDNADPDNFVFWGDMVLQDFNDVDRDLVDPDQLFVNVKRLREISAHYLTEEQVEAIRRYWGEERTASVIAASVNDRFWNHIGTEKSGDASSSKRFVRLWEILAPLYHKFNNALARRGLATEGMLYRRAVESIKQMSPADLPYTRYIFVGFNVLSMSEIKILSRLQQMGIADFYWDCNSPAFNADNESRAARFVKRNKHEFPSRYDLNEPSITEMPRINILGVPSAIGQVKAAGQQIRQWITESQITDTENAIDTAIVLPDESLLIPTIHSVPDEIGSLNVTMGFPMRLSPMAALIKAIVSLQLRSRRRREGGDNIYFVDDVKALLTAPAIRAINPEGCLALETEIRDRRLFNIPTSVILNHLPEFTPIIAAGQNLTTTAEINTYITGLCLFLENNVAADDPLQQRFIESYRTDANQLLDAARELSVELSAQSTFRLIERALATDAVRFVGEPLSGLQIMGVLETRALDFKNVIITSMNERIFPRRHFTRSLIPTALRRAYGMATDDFQESIYAYYFYRLISRAENVTLIYDARSAPGAKSNQMSRYLSQLLYLFPSPTLTHSLALYSAQRFTPPPIEMPKSKEVMNRLRRFCTGGGQANISASTLNTYINCPLEFYLQYVEGYNADNEATDYMDSSTYGTIVHHVMQKVYESMRSNNNEGFTVTESMLRPLTEPHNTTLDKLITSAINLHYNRLPDDHLLESLSGESLVLAKVIRASVVDMLNVDISLCPFTFVAAEKKMQGTLKVNENLTVNVKLIIDRIDITSDGIMRFVDYKTGSDAMKAPSVASLFETGRQGRAKAIMQLLLYCHLYNLLSGTDRPIRPLIYKILDISSQGLAPLRINKKEIDDYHDFIAEFVEILNEKLAEIFDPNIPFRQAPDKKACTFCQFKPICGREDD